MTRAAFFDVDGTLVDSDIVRYGVEIRTAEKGRAARLLWVAGFLPRVPWYLALDAVSRTAFQKSFYRLYRGLPAEEMGRRSAALYETYVRPRLRPEALLRLQKHVRKGDTVVLVTGSVEPIVRPLADDLGVRHVLAPRLEVEGGVVSGRLEGDPLAGERKADAVRGFAAERGIDLGDSFAYGDSPDDLPMLEAVGRPAVVNPGRKLRERATAGGWEILRWPAGALADGRR
ncbi:MAG TPA: HAD family hydrolase [Gemmatimonadota bacterium]|nr:HAD family hydrolase [Gemmatimonadota bacterium]